MQSDSRLKAILCSKFMGVETVLKNIALTSVLQCAKSDDRQYVMGIRPGLIKLGGEESLATHVYSALPMC
ncbi:MAG: hypothetical protein WCS90_04420 [Bacilli bacterium]